jgi:RimJ/RimL family protein N-acetyltransferase/ubiquinone/menaquinone biosynthesis C-methylase UbiE
MNIQDAFNAAAVEYDRLRRILIPCFDEFYRTAVEMIPGDRTRALRILDLGAGTGLYAGMVQVVFPQAELTLLDLATEMLAQAKTRFDQLGKSPNILVGDYLQADLDAPYDVIISALSIHHLTDDDKIRLYQKVFQALKPGGMFINADQVLGRTPEVEKLYQQQWLDAVRSRGISELDLRAAQHRMTFDRLAPLNEQLQWLEAAGFEQVDCWYKNLCFAVFGGSRPAQTASLSQPPILQTQRLILRPFILADAPDVRRLAGDRDVAARTLSIPHPYPAGAAEAWIQTHPQAFAQRKMVNYAIVLRSTGELCGAIGLSINATYHHGELGYCIGKPYWGNGYCPEAAAALLHYGFTELNLHRINSTHFSSNPASGRVMQKIGMTYEGCRREHTLKWGNYEDITLYGILKSDWQTLNQLKLNANH